MINEKGINLIKHFESLHDGDLSMIGLQPKQCAAGVWTIAFGHALKTMDNSRFLKGSQDKEEAYRQASEVYHMMTEVDAMRLLATDLLKFETVVKSSVTVVLSENQFSALVSFTYNCGSNALKSSTLLKKLNRADYQGAADEFLRWNKASGKVLRGLTLRREAERLLFLEK